MAGMSAGGLEAALRLTRSLLCASRAGVAVGSAVVLLTGTSAAATFSTAPKAARIAAVVFANCGGNDFGDIAVLAGDGSRRRRLTQDCVRGGYPSWSPDGRSIVYASAVGHEASGV